MSALIECTPSGCLAVTLLILMAFNSVFCLLAGILCAVEVSFQITVQLFCSRYAWVKTEPNLLNFSFVPELVVQWHSNVKCVLPENPCPPPPTEGFWFALPSPPSGNSSLIHYFFSKMLAFVTPSPLEFPLTFLWGEGGNRYFLELCMPMNFILSLDFLFISQLQLGVEFLKSSVT